MTIRDLLAAESINLNGTPAGKTEALNQCIDLMAKSGKIADVEKYRKGVFAREEVRSGIRPCFFVAHMYPFYLIVFSDCFVYFIQTVACYGVDAFNSGFYQSIYQLFCYFFCHSCNWFRIDFYVITDGCKEKF